MGYEKIVSEAAKVLDKNRPTWYREIDRATLDMQFSCNCICGQLQTKDFDYLDESMGFALSIAGCLAPDRRDQWNRLTSLWLAEINSRLEAAARDAFIERTNEIINQPLREEALPCPRT